ncbi:MAG: cbb3-type cytochrome c oxidase subunit I [Actinobacteria bacterium]|nr:cbb3-type cytochrome c oxidase subunit I [Actinomycetota bacterium]
MTVTETPPEVAAPARPAPAAVAPAARPPGLVAAVGSGDHKVVGRLYIGFSLLFLLASGVAGQLFSVDRVNGTLGDTILSKDTWFQVATFHSITALFLGAVPLLLGVAIVVVPLQIGSAALALPRAAAASFWGWLLGGGILVAAYIANGGPGGGSRRAVALSITALILVVVSLLLACVCVATTVLTLRAPGMSLDRTPLFSWSMLAGSVLWLVSLPTLVGVLILAYVDHRYGRVRFGAGGALYGEIRWVFLVPQVLGFALPVLGLLADTGATAARARLGQRGVGVAAVGLASFFSFGAWLQLSVSPGVTRQPVLPALALLALLPILAIGGMTANGIRTGERFRLHSGFLFAVLAWLQLLLAAVLGVGWTISRFDLQGTTYEGAVAHLALLAATTAGVGSLWYWATKVFGRPLAEGAGRLVAVLLFLGSIALAAPDAVSGAFGKGDEATKGIESLNALSAAGGGLVALAVVVAVLVAAMALSGRGPHAEVPADPWGGVTLEWRTGSPPPAGNFATPPRVISAEPMLDPTAEEATA